MRLFLYRIKLPLKVIKLKKGTFFLWLLFTIIAGLLGPIINIANNWGFNDLPISLSLFLRIAELVLFIHSLSY